MADRPPDCKRGLRLGRFSPAWRPVAIAAPQWLGLPPGPPLSLISGRRRNYFFGGQFSEAFRMVHFAGSIVSAATPARRAWLAVIAVLDYSVLPQSKRGERSRAGTAFNSRKVGSGCRSYLRVTRQSENSSSCFLASRPDAQVLRRLLRGLPVRTHHHGTFSSWFRCKHHKLALHLISGLRGVRSNRGYFRGPLRVGGG